MSDKEFANGRNDCVVSDVISRSKHFQDTTTHSASRQADKHSNVNSTASDRSNDLHDHAAEINLQSTREEHPWTSSDSGRMTKLALAHEYYDFAA